MIHASSKYKPLFAIPFTNQHHKPITPPPPPPPSPLTAVLPSGVVGQADDGAVDDQISEAADVADPARAGPHLGRHRHAVVVRAQAAHVQRAVQVQTVVSAWSGRLTVMSAGNILRT